MPGKQITAQQEKIYMQHRNQGDRQITAAAKAGISVRSGRSIEKGKRQLPAKRDWRTRPDPLEAVWSSELKPMLEAAPELSAMTLLEYLQEKYPDDYPDSLLRTLQRRVKLFKATEGPEKEIVFRQEHPIGRQGLSDFTKLKGIVITISGKPLKHLLYHFRLAYSGWSFMTVVQGGESYTALAEGLQTALCRLGGAPKEHRTDSLSAAFKNLSADDKEDITQRYEALCQTYGMLATRNNRGAGHENGSVESPHGHIKKRIKQALLIRGSNDFNSIDEYQLWLETVVTQFNRRNAKNIAIEREQLTPLPDNKAADYTELCARVSSSSTIDVRRTTYTVPSRLKGEMLRIHLYDNRLVCYLGTTHVQTLTRQYSNHKTGRSKQVDYRHIIESLYKKPQAFRYSKLRDDILPNDDYKTIWHYVNRELKPRDACKYIVSCLYYAAKYNVETELSVIVLRSINQGKLITLNALQSKFVKTPKCNVVVKVKQHLLAAYNQLIPKHREARHV